MTVVPIAGEPSGLTANGRPAPGHLDDALSHDGIPEALSRLATRVETVIEVSDVVYQEMAGHLERLEAELDELRTLVASLAAPVAQAAQPAGTYDEVVVRVRELVGQLTGPGATVAIVSKGDPALVELRGRTGWHFPRQADGTYLGFHPKDDDQALALLEETRRFGAGYVVFPATSLWWLEHYRGLRRHLEEHHTVVVHDPTTCAIFRLEGA